MDTKLTFHCIHYFLSISLKILQAKQFLWNEITSASYTSTRTQSRQLLPHRHAPHPTHHPLPLLISLKPLLMPTVWLRVAELKKNIVEFSDCGPELLSDTENCTWRELDLRDRESGQQM